MVFKSDRQRRAAFANMNNNPSDRRGNVNQNAIQRSSTSTMKRKVVRARTPAQMGKQFRETGRAVEDLTDRETQIALETNLKLFKNKKEFVDESISQGIEEKTVKKFLKERKPAFSDNNKKSSLLKTTGMVASFGDVLLKTQKEKNLFKIRMLKAGLEKKGLSFPKDFDKLPQAEQERRLNKVIAITRKN